MQFGVENHHAIILQAGGVGWNNDIPLKGFLILGEELDMSQGDIKPLQTGLSETHSSVPGVEYRSRPRVGKRAASHQEDTE